MVDARREYAPERVPGLIKQAARVTDTKRDLAERLGVTPRYLAFLERGDRQARYPLQVALEQLLRESSI